MEINIHVPQIFPVLMQDWRRCFYTENEGQIDQGMPARQEAWDNRGLEPRGLEVSPLI